MKDLFKTVAVLLFAICLLGNAFAAGSRQSSSGDDKTLKWIFYNPTGSTYYELHARLFERYERQTGVKVVIDAYPPLEYVQVFELKVGTGSRDYDVLSVEGNAVPAFANRGYLQPLDQWFTEAEKRRYIPSAVESGTWDGKFYAPPMNTSSQILWYNKTLLAQGGVTVRPSDLNNRLTYEEVTDYARQALNRLDPNGTNGIIGLMFEQYTDYQKNPIANSMGGKNIGDDGWTVNGVINSPEWIRAMTWYQNLYRDGLALRGSLELYSLFQSGKILFMVGGTWNAPSQINPDSTINLDFDCGYAPVPAFRGYENRVGTATGSWHYGINHISSKQNNVIDFLKWITFGEGNRAWIEQSTLVPSTMEMVEAIARDPNANPIQKISAYEAGNTAVPRARTVGYPEYSTIIGNAWDDVRNGSDVRATLDRAVRDIESAFARYR